MLGINIDYVEVPGQEVPEISGVLELGPEHLNPAGTVHAATVVALADTACGYGCLASLPPSASGFTTIELNANYLGTAGSGQRLEVLARAVHRGSTTQVWDATVTASLSEGAQADKTIAVFRCTQMVLYPR